MEANVFTKALKRAGYRITTQRRAVCDYLYKTNTHPTPYQVYAQIVQEHPDISRATVYNTLSTLKNLGVIAEINVGDDHTHYETDTTPHVNLICLGCHKVVDHFGPTLPDHLVEVLAQETGFHPVAAKSEIYGFCKECQDHKRAEIREQWQQQHRPTIRSMTKPT